MKYIDITLPTPAANLALDEALLDHCDAGRAGEVLRFWESSTPFVVIGYGNEAAREVNLEACNAAGISVLRRCSGGGTVRQGPGCLSYSLILKISENPALQSIATTNQFILKRNQAALEPLIGKSVSSEGQTDLAIGNLKFSGNAQRRKRDFLLFHGTFLLNFELPLVEKYLRDPSAQPEYRQQRSHTDFVTNLRLDGDAVKNALRAIWNAREPLAQSELPSHAAYEQKYSSAEWNRGNFSEGR